MLNLPSGQNDGHVYATTANQEVKCLGLLIIRQRAVNLKLSAVRCELFPRNVAAYFTAVCKPRFLKPNSAAVIRPFSLNSKGNL